MKIRETINVQAIYVMWLREMKRFVRARSRILSMLVMPLFFLAFLGTGLNPSFKLAGLEDVDYINFLAPGIVGMTMLFTSVFAGISVLWDKEFGFLKEIMVAPVSRVSIVLGRIIGGVTTAMIQGILVLAISLFMGIKITGFFGFLSSLLFMVLISAAFIGLGLIFASKMEDPHGFSLIMNFIIFPLFFLSGALFPLENLPSWLSTLVYVDPLTYGVDGLRGSLIGVSKLPLFLDGIILSMFCASTIFLGAYLFERVEVG